MKRKQKRVAAVIPADKAWVPLVQCLAENGAGIFGLDPAKGLRLSMGMEEVLVHLAGILPEADVDIEVESGPCAVRATFSVAADALDLSAMNFAAGAGVREGGEQDLPLILASRMSDGLGVSRSGSQVHLTLRQDHAYDRIEPVLSADNRPCAEVRVESVTEYHLIAHACAGILGRFDARELPSWMARPAGIVDRVRAGELVVCVALDAADTVRAMLLWEWISDKSVAFSGPWMLDACTQGIDPLLEYMLSSLARSSVCCLFSDPDATPPGLDLSGHGFELLAKLKRGGYESAEPLPVWFRHLREDDGLRVWAHPSCIPFLEEVYENICLIRTIQPVESLKSRTKDRSLFATALNREKKEAVLRPLLDGWDNAENIARHLRVLRNEGFERILFRLDLAEGWQAALGGDLVEQGCKPTLVLPLAGGSDVLLLAYVRPVP